MDQAVTVLRTRAVRTFRNNHYDFTILSILLSSLRSKTTNKVLFFALHILSARWVFVPSYFCCVVSIYFDGVRRCAESKRSNAEKQKPK